MNTDPIPEPSAKDRALRLIETLEINDQNVGAEDVKRYFEIALDVARAEGDTVGYARGRRHGFSEAIVDARTALLRVVPRESND